MVESSEGTTLDNVRHIRASHKKGVSATFSPSSSPGARREPNQAKLDLLPSTPRRGDDIEVIIVGQPRDGDVYAGFKSSAA